MASMLLPMEVSPSFQFRSAHSLKFCPSFRQPFFPGSARAPSRACSCRLPERAAFSLPPPAPETIFALDIQRAENAAHGIPNSSRTNAPLRSHERNFVLPPDAEKESIRLDSLAKPPRSPARIHWPSPDFRPRWSTQSRTIRPFPTMKNVLPLGKTPSESLEMLSRQTEIL